MIVSAPNIVSNNIVSNNIVSNTKELTNSIRTITKRELANHNTKKKQIYVNEEGQIALSFALGVLLSPYTYRIFWLIVFLAIFELGYWLIMGTWFMKLRLGLVIAYLLGILVGVYALDREWSFM